MFLYITCDDVRRIFFTFINFYYFYVDTQQLFFVTIDLQFAQCTLSKTAQWFWLPETKSWNDSWLSVTDTWWTENKLSGLNFAWIKFTSFCGSFGKSAKLRPWKKGKNEVSKLGSTAKFNPSEIFLKTIKGMTLPFSDF